jgi:uncharacterized protein YcbK (DUF882 family)
MTKISKDFTLEEMIWSEEAEKHGLCNKPDKDAEKALEELVTRTLQPLRQAYGRPIRISSGYRCPELNQLVGGKPSSQHTKGEAADCTADNTGRLLDLLLAHRIPFDQAILYKKRNFLHVSLRAKHNRRQVIILALCLLFCSCGASRQRRFRQQETAHIERLQTDSLQAEGLAREWRVRKVEVQRIEYMKPDSSGRQYVQSATFLASEEETRTEEASAFASRTAIAEKTERKSDTLHHSLREIKTSQGGWWLWGMIGVACFYVWRTYGN